MNRKMLPLMGLLLVAVVVAAGTRSSLREMLQSQPEPTLQPRATQVAAVEQASVDGGFNALTPQEAQIILKEGTEPPFSGRYHDSKEVGLYICKQCDQPLFDSETKFDSRTGWPSFDDSLPGAIREVQDGSRTEIECSSCGGHVGHVFRGEKMTPKSTRHCANSLSLSFLDNTRAGRAIFAGGCFWGVEHLLEQMPGVLTATSGYIGGHTVRPTYEKILRKDTGHAEAVEVRYDTSKISYEELAKMFFEIHDPTQLDRQGPDVGDQYRSAVFYLSEAQKETAHRLIGVLKEKGLEVVTQVVPAGEFWIAEGYHQDYYVTTGESPYCHFRTKRF